MTDSTSPALRVALAYHQAWSSKDLDRAMAYIAQDIVCDAPAGRIEGAEAYRAFMGPFVQMLLETDMIAAFGDDETALVMYDTRTVPVASAPESNASRSGTARSSTAGSCSTAPRSRPPGRAADRVGPCE